jgi:squalene-hopene/tetraprenyl-beta-curcumene cyclase
MITITTTRGYFMRKILCAGLALIACVQAGTCIGAEPDQLTGSTNRDVKVSISQGLDWLASIQKEDGSWSNPAFPALTGLPLLAFAMGEHSNKTAIVEKAVKFILSNVQEDGGIYKKSLIPGKGGLGTYNTAICMRTLHALGDPAHVKVIQNARSYIAGSQLTGDTHDGGFGYSKGGWFASSDMMNTYHALEAMRVTQSVEDLRTNQSERVDLRWDDAVKYIERMQNKAESGEADAGGFFYKPGKSMAGTTNSPSGKQVFRSYGTMTYVGILSMIYSDLPKDDTRVRSALDWAMKHWSLDENPGMGAQGMYYFYHILAKSLTVAKVDKITRPDGTILDWRDEVTKRMLDLQRDNGSWLNENGRYWEADPVLVTAYIITALEMIQAKAPPSR